MSGCVWFARENLMTLIEGLMTLIEGLMTPVKGLMTLRTPYSPFGYCQNLRNVVL
jgi:hypothetical protein